MSEEFVKVVFEPFVRERSSTASGIQGTGLGMTITKNIVDMMGGSIVCHSKENEGTEFVATFDFRLQTEQKKTAKSAEIDHLQENVSETAAGKENPKEVDFSGKRILLVEDNELNREIATEILKEEGLTVEEAVNGSDAVDKLLERGAGYYDLVLMDIQMPVMDGYTAAQKIRTFPDKKLADIPIIAVSANAFEEDKKKSFDAGMNAHISKPIDAKILMDTLTSLL
jgi:CheY-like chemotaxis protein